MEIILEIICLKKKKDRAYVINLDEYAVAGTHWIALYCKYNGIIYFDIFGAVHVARETEKIIGHKNIKANIFRIQTNN